jgi:uncharacterized membrane protein YkoI
MNRKIVAAGTGLAIALTGGGVAIAGTSGGTGGSRLDDGKDLLPQSQISEQQAIKAAQGAASGGLNEVDLEHRAGKLVWNVDVGKSDVKVDASSGDVLAVDHDD